MLPFPWGIVHNNRSPRRSVRNIQIIQGGKDLTAQAGLIPVVQFLKKHGFVSKIEQSLDHQRGATGVYDAVDMILLPLVAIIGGARSISSIVMVWNDRVLSLAAGWLRIPDESTIGDIAYFCAEKHQWNGNAESPNVRKYLAQCASVRQQCGGSIASYYD